MVRLNEIRANEIAVELPSINDAQLIFIGRIRTPWTIRLECPRQGRADGPLCTIEIDERWQPALDGIETHGTFSLRTPVRPNPIGTSIAHLVSRNGNVLTVRGLDCLDGTPLIDLKPDRTLFTPIAPAQPGDFQTG